MLETLHMGPNNIKRMIPSTLKSLCSLQVVDLMYNSIGGGYNRYNRDAAKLFLEQIAGSVSDEDKHHWHDIGIIAQPH
jgi:hypothetical protein